MAGSKLFLTYASLICGILISLTGSAWGESIAGSDQPELLPMEQYFPLETGVVYVYKLSSLSRTYTINLDPFSSRTDGDNYQERHYIYLTREHPEDSYVFFDCVGSDEQLVDRGPVFDANSFIGMWDPVQQNFSEPEGLTGLQLWPPDLRSVGTRWQGLAEVFAEGKVKVAGRAASLENIELFGFRYADCLRIEYRLNIEAEIGNWLIGDGHANAEATLTLWLAPDTGIVVGELRLNTIDSDLKWLQNYRVLEGAELFRLELLARVPQGADRRLQD